MKKTLEITEVVSTVIGCIVSGSDYQKAYSHCARVLKNAVNFKYEDKLSLEDNLLEYYRQNGYERLENVCREFFALMSNKPGTHFTADAADIRMLAADNKVPETLQVDIIAQTAKAENDHLVMWFEKEAYCAFCHKLLKVHKDDKTGFIRSADNCTCEGFQNAQKTDKPDTPLILWAPKEAYCRFCGKPLPIHRHDKTGYLLSAGDCSCKDYQQAKNALE